MFKRSVLFSAFFCFSLVTHAGFLTNGGDAVVGDFMNTYDQIIEKMKSNPDDNLKFLTFEFQNLETIVRLSSDDRVFLEGVEKGAINISDGDKDMKIVISRTLWPKHQFRSKALLVIHELLPLAGYNDQLYRKSNGIINTLWPVVNDYQIPVPCEDLPTYLRRNGDVVAAAYELCINGKFTIGSLIFNDCVNDYARQHIVEVGREEGRCL